MTGTQKTEGTLKEIFAAGLLVPADRGLVVKRKRFSVEQITRILKHGELGTPIAILCCQSGIAEQSHYRYKKTYGGLEPSEARELKQLREENTKVKRLVADLSLEDSMLQDVLQNIR
jgi:putative transposase